MKRIILALFVALLVLSVTPLKAQYDPELDELPVLVPDRPGYTWGAEVLPLHKVSWENGFCFESLPDGTKGVTLNSTVVRYGIVENVELRVGTDFLLLTDDPAKGSSLGVAPLTVGTKIKVYEGEGWLPSVGVLAQFGSSRIGSKELLPSHLTPSMYLLFEHALGDAFWLCYDAGLEWDGETATPQTFLSLTAGYNFTDELGAFVETANYLHPEDGNQYLTNFGLTWMPSRRLQLDLECDLDPQEFGKYFGLCFGVSWMIN